MHPLPRDHADTRQQLEAVERYLARLTEQVRKVEGERDTLLNRLADNEGCHDRRPALR